MQQPTSIFHSLRFRIITGLLAIFLVGLWLLAIFAVRLLRHDLLEQLSAQQVSTATFLAGELDEELRERVSDLELTASSIGTLPTIDPAAIQRQLDGQILLGQLFNGGVIAVDARGVVVAELPAGLGFIGKNFRQLSHLTKALSTGRAAISEPHRNAVTGQGEFGLAVPIRDRQGRIIGALTGIIDLDRANFIDEFSLWSYGLRGGFVLISPTSRQVVTARDKSRTLEGLPAPGAIPALDRFIAGQEGSSVFVNPHGLEILATTRRVPITGWMAEVYLPTGEAFAPILALQQRMLLSALVLTMAVGWLAWLLLQRQLAPLSRVAVEMERLSAAPQDFLPMPVARRDEVGSMITAFNLLMADLSNRERRLQDNQDYTRGLIEASLDPLVTIDPEGKITDVNRATEQITGLDRGSLIGSDFCDYFTEPAEARRGYQMVLNQGEVRDYPLSLRNVSGRIREVLYNASVYRDPAGERLGVFAAARDVTEWQRLEEISQARLQMLEKAYAIGLGLEDTMRLMLDEIENRTGSAIGFYHFLEEDQQTLSLQGWSSNTLATMCTAEGKGTHYPIATAGVWADCVRERRPVIHNDYAALPHRKPLPEGHAPIIRELVVPIFRGTRIVAIIGVGNKLQEYDETDLKIVSLLGDFSWEIVTRKLAELELTSLNEQLEQRVAERTAELAEKNRELEKANKLFIGRELRMVELKARIKELERQALMSPEDGT